MSPLNASSSVRPFLSAEVNKRTCLSIKPAEPPATRTPQITIHQRAQSDLASFFSLFQRGGSAGSGSPNANDQRQSTFHFDDIYHADCDQTEVFRDLVEPLLDRFFEGVNCTLLAYGQTSSGKSYTMGTGGGEHASSDAAVINSSSGRYSACASVRVLTSEVTFSRPDTCGMTL